MSQSKRVDECIQRLDKTPCPPAGVVRLKGRYNKLKLSVSIIMIVLDMDKPDTQCPLELTGLSAQAVDDINMVEVLITMQKNNSVQLRIKTAIERVLKGMVCVKCVGLQELNI